jgi:hypothetical protein
LNFVTLDSAGSETNRATITSTGLNSTAIGATTPSTGAFTTLTATTGEFSGGLVALPANGVLITSSSANSIGFGKVTPSGSAIQSNFILYAGSDTANANFLNIKANNFETMLDTNKSGTGTTQPLVLKFDGVEVGRLTSTGLAVTGALSSTTGANFATSSGNVGIGTATPTFPLCVSSNSGTDEAFVSGIAGGAYFGAVGVKPVIFQNNGLERMRIDSSGNVGIGSGNATNGKLGINFAASGSLYGISLCDSLNASAALFVTFQKSDGTTIGSISRVTTTDAVVYNTTSDARLKENLRDFTDSGRLIDSLKPRVFDWKNSDENGKNVVGFIAQEEHAADPIFAHIGAVSVGDEDPETITKQWQRSDSALIPILVAELKSVRARLAALESK